MVAKAKKSSPLFIPCTPKRLSVARSIIAAATAVEENPANLPLVQGVMEPGRIAALTTKYWKSGGVILSVSFMDNPPASVRRKILENMNAWNKTGNVEFTETAKDGQVRIARDNTGYWSYLGTDILSIPRNEQTMNLQDFTDNTPESEYIRVVRHETGHTMGFPHEHMRKQLVARLDVQKTIAYFMETQGWSAEEVRQQVLTPLEEKALIRTANADAISIMCYQLPGSITKDGQPIKGGNDIDAIDFEFVGKLYPKVTPPTKPPSTGLPESFTAETTLLGLTYDVTFKLRK